MLVGKTCIVVSKPWIECEPAGYIPGQTDVSGPIESCAVVCGIEQGRVYHLVVLRWIQSHITRTKCIYCIRPLEDPFIVEIYYCGINSCGDDQLLVVLFEDRQIARFPLVIFD